MKLNKKLNEADIAALNKAVEAADIQANTLGWKECGLLAAHLISQETGNEIQEILPAIALIEKLSGFNHSAIRQKLAKEIFGVEPKKAKPNSIQDMANAYLN